MISGPFNFQVGSALTNNNTYLGLSTDVKPVNDQDSIAPAIGDLFYQTDNGLSFIWTGKTWAAYVGSTGSSSITLTSDNSLTVTGSPGSTLALATNSAATNTYYPATPVTAATINAAATAANAAGGGFVVIPAGTYTMSATIVLLAGVVFVGSGWQLAANSVTVPAAGTWLVGNGTFPIFGANTTDLANPYGSIGALKAQLVPNCGVMNVGMSDGTYGIKCGALFQAGPNQSVFKNCIAINMTQWAYWFENFNLCAFDDLQYFACPNGTCLMGSGQAINNFGNSRLFGSKGGGVVSPGSGPYGRGLLIGSRFASQLNDIDVIDFGTSGNANTNSQTATITEVATTITGSTTNIAISNASGLFAVGGLVAFSATLGNLTVGVFYMITASSTTNIQVALCAAASISNGSPIINLNNVAGLYAVNGQVTFSATVGTSGGQVVAGTSYFIVAAGQSQIQVSAINGGTPITFNASGLAAVALPALTPSTSGTPNVGVITVPDTSQYIRGTPVSFGTTVSGFKTAQIFFVLAQQSNSGAGAIILGNQTGGTGGGAAICPNASSAPTLSYKGMPILEVGGQDAGSQITWSSVTCSSDVEGSGTGHIVLQGLNGFKGDLGIFGATGGQSTQNLVVRNSAYVQLFITAASGNFDNDNNATLVIGAYQGANVVQRGGSGIRQQANSLCSLNLTGNPAAEDLIASSNGGINWNTGQYLLTSQPTTTNVLSINNGNVAVFVTSAGGSLTLPTIAAAYVGYALDLINPTANTIAVGTGSSQNIIGLGASGTSITLAASTSTRLIACSNAGTFFWGRVS